MAELYDGLIFCCQRNGLVSLKKAVDKYCYTIKAMSYLTRAGEAMFIFNIFKIKPNRPIAIYIEALSVSGKQAAL